MLKKMMLLAMAVGALVAFAIPASASAAATWADNDSHLGTGQHATAPFEGELRFFAGAPIGSFGCQVTAVVTAEGPAGGVITVFNPTTTSCTGTELFKGCVLTGDSSNIEEENEATEEVEPVWGISLAANGTSATVAKTNGGNLTIHNTYASCFTGETTLEFAAVTLTPVLNANGTITKLNLSGTAVNGIVASGSLTPEGSLTLGIDPVE